MASGDSEFRIGITTDTSGADAGLGRVAGELDHVKGKTDETADASEKGGGRADNATLQNRRNLMRLAESFVELKEGGIDAFAGIAEEAFLAGESMDLAMGPVGLALLAISIMIPVLTRAWGDHKKAVGDNKEEAEQLQKAFEAAQKSIDDGIKATTQAFKDQLASEKAYSDFFATREGQLAAHVKALAAVRDAIKDVTLAQLENQEATELAGVTDEKQIALIKEKYKLHEEEVTAQNDADKNLDEQKIKGLEIDATTNQRLIAEQGRAKIYTGLQDAQIRDYRAGDAAQSEGITPDGAGPERFKPAHDLAVQQQAEAQKIADATAQAVQQQQKIIADDQAKLEGLRKQVRDPADEFAFKTLTEPVMNNRIKNEQANLTGLQNDATLAQTQLRQAKEKLAVAKEADEAAQAFAAAQNGAVQPIKDFTDQITKFNAALADDQLDLVALKKESAVPGLKLATEKQTTTNDATVAAAKAEAKPEHLKAKGGQGDDAAAKGQVADLQRQLKANEETIRQMEAMLKKYNELAVKQHASSDLQIAHNGAVNETIAALNANDAKLRQQIDDIKKHLKKNLN